MASSSDSQNFSQIYLLIQALLAASPFQEAAKTLQREMERQQDENSNQFLPKRLDFEGKPHRASLQENLEKLQISKDTLGQVLQRYHDALVRSGGELAPNLQDLLVVPSQKTIATRPKVKQHDKHSRELELQTIPRPRPGFLPYLAPLTTNWNDLREQFDRNTVRFVRNVFSRLECRGMGGQGLTSQTKQWQAVRAPWNHFEPLFRVQGHSLAVFCAVFDKTGSRIITGSDDFLVKVWNVETGWLIHTLRGHSDVVVDVTVNEEGTLIASASQDNTIRVWDLKTGFPVAVLTSHVQATKGFTALSFSPAPLPQMRYLLVTGEDGFSRLWSWNKDTLDFKENDPIVLDCKSLGRDEARCCSWNRTGSRFVVGGTDGMLRVFAVSEEGEVKLVNILGVNEGESHIGHVTVVHFSKDSTKILSGGVDGSIRIWTMTSQGDWKLLKVDLKPLIPPIPLARVATAAGIERRISQRPIASEDDMEMEDVDTARTTAPIRASSLTTRSRTNLTVEVDEDVEMEDAIVTRPVASQEDLYPHLNPKKFRVSGACWSLDGSHVVAASSDRMVRVFTSQGELIHTFQEHDDEVFVLAAHPWDNRIVLSAGHDGKMCLWDIYSGELIWSRLLDHPILEAKFSEDGFKIVVADSFGTAQLFGVGCDAYKYAEVPMEQYFPSDYNPLRVDANFYVADEQTGQLPHLMPRVAVCNAGGHPYPERVGKEKEGLDLPVELDPEILKQMEQDRLQWLRLEPKVDLVVPDLETVKKLGKKRSRKAVVYDSDDEEELMEILNEVPIVESDNDEDYSGNSEEEPGDFLMESEDESEEFGFDSDEDRPRTRKHPGRSSPNVSLRKRTARTYTERSDEEETDSDAILNAESSQSTKPRKRVKIDPSTYLPTEWISASTPTDFPYRPQLLDRVAYLTSGHEKWWQVATEGVLNDQGEVVTLPEPDWLMKKLIPPDPADDRVKFAKIVDIKYEIGPPSFCTLELVLCEPFNDQGVDKPSTFNPTWSQEILPKEILDSRGSWTVSWFDRDGNPDFIIPVHLYSESMKTRYAVGDEVVVSFGEDESLGKLVEAPVNSHDPWASWLVEFEDGSQEALSPWEFSKRGVEKLPNPTIEPEKTEAVLQLLDEVMSKREWLPFVTPVDKTAYPRYYRQVPYPICLEQIRSRVASGWYRSVEQLSWDLRQMQQNALEFNPSGTVLHSFAERTLDNFIGKIDGLLNGRNPAALHRPIRKLTIKLKPPAPKPKEESDEYEDEEDDDEPDEPLDDEFEDEPDFEEEDDEEEFDFDSDEEIGRRKSSRSRAIPTRRSTRRR